MYVVNATEKQFKYVGSHNMFAGFTEYVLTSNFRQT